MQVLFTRRDDMPVSRWIVDVTGEPVSHTAIRLGDFVYQSSFLGVVQTPYKEFAKNYIIRFSLAPIDSDYNDRLAERLIYGFPKLKNKPYDYPGLFYLSMRYILKKYCGMGIPKKNLWQLSGMYLCTEFVEDILNEESDAMITPYKLYFKMLDSGKWQVTD